MSGEQRKEIILQCILNATKPVSATYLAGICKVSRQVIVQDVAILRASGYDIVATNRGYVKEKPLVKTKIFKVRHTDEELSDELGVIVRLGAVVEDVFIKHKVYGKVQAVLNLNSLEAVKEFVKKIETGESSPLKNLTADYHYHTVTADSDNILADVELALREKGYLVE